jgi:hypothetical protein
MQNIILKFLQAYENIEELKVFKIANENEYNEYLPITITRIVNFMIASNVKKIYIDFKVHGDLMCKESGDVRNSFNKLF